LPLPNNGKNACIRPVKKAGGDDLTRAFHILELQLLPLLPSPLTSIKLANPGSLGKMAVKTETDLFLRQTQV